MNQLILNIVNRKNITREFSLYFLMSLIAFVLDMLVFSALFRFAHVSWSLSALLSFCVGVTFLYLASTFFVFEQRKLVEAPAKEFIIFIFLGLVSLLVTQFILFLGIEIFSMSAELVKLIAAGISFVSNFVMRKMFLYVA